MATIRKQRDKWQAQIRMRGIKPIAKSFDKKADAVAWARIAESEITRGTYVDPRKAASTTVADVIDRYLELLRSKGKHDRPREARCKRLRCDLGAFTLDKLSMQHLAGYRDRRLEVANPATVIHELALLRRLLNLAVNEWGIKIPGGVPKVQLPKMPHGRIRRLSQNEESRLLDALEDTPVLKSLVVFTIETAMRRSEIANMRWKDIDFDQKTLTIPKTKTGVSREIPLSYSAIAAIAATTRVGEKVFALDAQSITRAFRRACSHSGVTNLRFHDLRHEATSRLFEKGLNVIEVSSITGHSSLEMLKRYSHPRASLLAKKLATADATATNPNHSSQSNSGASL